VFSHKLVANRQEKRSVGLQHAGCGGEPRFGPFQVFLFGPAIVVDIVPVADIEWRIREHQVHRSGLQARQNLDAISLDHAVPHHSEILLESTSPKSLPAKPPGNFLPSREMGHANVARFVSI
jgi:hypothetical protein